MDKVTLRRQFRQKRKALVSNEVRQRSEQITGRFFNFLAQYNFDSLSATIHVFLPIQRQNEVNTWPIIRSIWTNYPYLNIAVSVTNVSENTLRHYLLLPETQLIENRWGIPEPIIIDQYPIDPIDFDMVLVPLLAFDQQGQRIGYGGGFYDRFLAECHPKCLKVGLSLFEPVGCIDDIEPTDVPLDSCITPKQVYVFE